MAEEQQKTNQTEAVDDKEANESNDAGVVEVSAGEPNGKAAEGHVAEESPVELDETSAEAAAGEEPEATAEATVEESAKVPEEALADEESSSAVAEEIPESAEAKAPAEQEKAPVASTAEPEALPATGRVGFTGEIIGRVVKLEDLDGSDGEDGAVAQNYDQLMRMVDESFKKVSEQEIVRGRVVSVGEKDVVIDIGFKSDGVVSLNEFDRELKAGDEVDVFIDRLEDHQGQLVLSKTKADKQRRWERIENAYNNEEVLEGTIVRRIKGGMIAELFDGMEAFLPGSQIDVRPVRDFDAYLGSKMEFKIVKLNPANENIVVSHKALIEKDLEAQRAKILSTMEPGQILEGTVKNITDFGVFIDLGGVDGLLHITDLSWGRVSHPSELVDLDEKLNVVVLDYDKDRQRISLGLKQLQPHPWENIKEKFVEGTVVEGKVVSITDYGAFVELEKGIEGLVHISEMSWTEHIRHPSQMVSLGQLVKVKILNIDKDGKKISLGMKQMEPDPWVGIADRYPPGTVLRGKVRNITNFGVFVEIEPGIDGLVHISDLSWTKKVRHPSEVVKKGQDLDVVILNVDPESRRISLGHKQVETNPWNQFAKVYAEGTDAEAKVIRTNEGGLVVELGMEVEAFVPASELRSGAQNFENAYQPGQTLELRVIKFDPNQKEIVLSETAKDRAEERVERVSQEREVRDKRDRERREVREFTKKAAEASGPTTLGELSGLADLKAQIETAEQQAVDDAKANADEASREAAELASAESMTVPEPEQADAMTVDEGPEEQADAAGEESDATVVATAKASEEMEGTAGTTARSRAGKRKEEDGDKRTDESKGAATEPPASGASSRRMPAHCPRR
ncbi:MAG: 30S ribosomal protein S1, partial [Rhodothermales bacterium]